MIILIRALWIASTLARAIMAFRLPAVGLLGRYPALTAYLAFSSTQSILSMADKWLHGNYAGKWIALVPIAIALQCLMTLECFHHMVRHLPNVRVFGWVLLIGFGGLSIAVVLATSSIADDWTGLIAARTLMIRHYSLACLLTVAACRWFCRRAGHLRINTLKHSAALMLLLGGHVFTAAIVGLTREYWTVGFAQVMMQVSAIIASALWWRMDGDGEEWIPPVPPCGGNGREDARRVSRAAAAAIGG